MNAKKIFSLLLSFLMAVSVFSVIPASALTVDTQNNYKNITFVDESQEVSSGTNKTFAQKKANLIAYSNYEGTELELNGITNEFLKAKYASQTSSIKSITYEGYKGKNDAYDTPTSAVFSLSENNGAFKNMTDGVIIEDAVSTTRNSFWNPGNWVNGTAGITYENWYIKTHNNSPEGMLYGTERAEAGFYDAKMTLALSSRSFINSVLYSGSPDVRRTALQYGIFVADDVATLYDDKNLVAYYDYSKMADDGNELFNNASTPRSETQIWDFTTKKPVGSYVGIMIYDLALGDGGQFTEFAVYGDDVITFVDESKEVNYKDTKKFETKKALLNVDSKYVGTTLEMFGLSNAYLSQNYVKEENKFYNRAAKIKQYGEDTSGNTVLSNSTDFDMFNAQNNGSSNFSYSYVKKGYDATATGDKVYGLERIEKDFYDIDITLDLGGKTELTDFYMFGHYNPTTCFVTYGLFIADSEADLYKKENMVALYDYYEAACKNNDQTYKFNNMGYSEGQVWKFTGQKKPTGKYLGIRIYDASNNGESAAFLSIYEIGAYGTTYLSTSEVVSAKTVSSSGLTAVVKEPYQAPVVTDAEGKTADKVIEGKAYTFKAFESADPEYSFKGWYEGDEFLSSELVYNVESFGAKQLTAVYETKAILDIEAGENVTMKSNWPNVGKTYSYAYDVEEDAMMLTASSDSKMEKGSLISTLTVNGKNGLTAQYKPWTTYKYSVVAKVESEEEISVRVGLGAHSLALELNYSKIIKSGEDYKEYTFYFNSGAANFNGSAANSTAHVATNMFNYDLPEGATMLVKSFKIEEVNNVKITADNATVDIKTNKYLVATHTAKAASDDSTDYEGNTTVKTVSPWLIGKLNDAGFYGAAKTGDTISFAVTPDDGYAVKSVTVGGVEATEENGIYTATVPAGTAYSGISQAVSDYVEIVVATEEAHVCEYKEIVKEEFKATGATCTAAATYYKSCECGEVSEETFSYGEVDATAHTGEKVEDQPAVEATCKTEGKTASTKWSCCNAPAEAAQNLGFNTNNHEGGEVEDAPAITATCKTEGFTASTKYECCGAPATAAQSLGFNANNHEGDIVASEDNKPATETEPGLEGKTVYSCCPDVVVNAGTETPALGYLVTFNDYNGSKLFETRVQAGKSAEAVANEVKALAVRYGYTFSAWDGDTSVINANSVFTAVYVRNIEPDYTLTIDGEPVAEMAFDAKITVKNAQKVLWTVNGQKYHIGETAVMYAFGDMSVASEELGELDENKAFVSLLGTVKENGKFVAFVHVYKGAEEISEFGAYFWNTENEVSFKKLSFTSGNDVMATLYGIGAGKGRGVKAYATINGTDIYSETSDTNVF